MCIPGLPGDVEQVQLYDVDGRPSGVTDRARMRAENLTHAATAVVVRDSYGRVFVHRRTDTKDVYPGRFDFAAGGVVAAGEDPHVAAVRELDEELGVTGVPLELVRIAHYADDHLIHAVAHECPTPHRLPAVSLAPPADPLAVVRPATPDPGSAPSVDAAGVACAPRARRPRKPRTARASTRATATTGGDAA